MELPQNILNLTLDKGHESEPQKQSVDTQQTKKHLTSLRIMSEKRRGKWATIIWSDATLTETEANDLAKQLKQKLAVGGSTRDGEILLQGNIKEKAIELIKQMGYKIH